LTRLRQICCHPSLFIENYQGGSGKLDMLLELLDNAFDGGHRILLFSQFTGMLSLIRRELEKKTIGYHYLDGSTKSEERIRLVNSFNAGENNIFLISLKAGGTGLNLTGADVVIHFDPWWNPAVEDQATDRAYRIGQKNSVQVFKLITRNTLEEKIYDLQQKKKKLIDCVIKPGENFLSKMSAEEVRQLFELD
jgi:SNF2 family DNA or RNA helicase